MNRIEKSIKTFIGRHYRRDKQLNHRLKCGAICGFAPSEQQILTRSPFAVGAFDG